ncbi:prostaglandin E receptor 4 (subtype EP4) b [Syngnathoides biaculeatus]|uniref:prostaglandin E receptor 4 (subtype EP4) b n=1 Tax=Syngnathoides biaculeatus TaxID=300417 RepID=UPI002ADE826B|nr:prostaglandin E receptor 4 (subtype EP4) b [Syngnathoides biaculeatus]
MASRSSVVDTRKFAFAERRENSSRDIESHQTKAEVRRLLHLGGGAEPREQSRPAHARHKRTRAERARRSVPKKFSGRRDRHGRLHLRKGGAGTMNGSGAPQAAHPPRGFQPPTIPVIMFIFGVVGNVTAVVVLRISRKEQKETTFYTLVCGLAVTDLLGTLLASPVTIATYARGSWPGGQPLCQFSGFVLLFFFAAQLCIVCAMSVERYLAINHAYFHNDYVDQRLAALALLAIYAGNAGLCALPAAGWGQVKLQRPGSWCFVDWHGGGNGTSAAAFNLVYAGVNAAVVLATVACNVLVCGALILMHRRFVRRTSLAAHEAASGGPAERRFARRRSLGRLAGAEIQMVILLIATSAVVLVCSIPLLLRIFVNQLYSNQREESTGLNKDLLAIRMASVNPILDPWVYILLRKTVVLTLVEKIKCLFCKMGRRRRRRGGGGGPFPCGAGGPFPCRGVCLSSSSSVASRDSPSLVSGGRRGTSGCTSLTFLYPADGGTASFRERADGGSGSPGGETAPAPTWEVGPESSKPTLQVSLADGTPNARERCI